MNRLYQFICLFIAITCFIGCDSPGQKPTLDYLPVKLDKEDRWGMIGPDGKMLFNDEFEKEPSPVVNGVFSVEEDNGYSLYLAKEKPILIPEAEGFKSVGYCNKGLIPVVREGERIKLIDTNGKCKLILEPINEEEIISCGRLFLDGNLIIQLASGKWGAINHNGKVTIEPHFDKLEYAGQNIFLGYIYNKSEEISNELFGLDRSGKVLFKLKGNYTPIDNVYHWGYTGGRLAVNKGDAVGYINLNGEYTKLPSKYKGYIPFSDQYFGFINEDNKFGIVNGENDLILRAKYKFIWYLGDNLFYVLNGDSNQIINAKGEIKAEIDEENQLIPLYLMNHLLQNSFGLIGGATHSLMLYDTDGKPVTKTDFYEIGLSVFEIGDDMYMHSDYYDYEGIIKEIADRINVDVYQDVRIGFTLNKYIENGKGPRDYVHKNVIEKRVDDLKFPNSGVKLRIYADSDIATARSKYDFFGYFDGYEYEWNNRVTIKEISLTMKGSKRKFNDVKEILISNLNQKGFKTMVDEPENVILSKDGSDVIFQLTSNQFLISILPTRYGREVTKPQNQEYEFNWNEDSDSTDIIPEAVYPAELESVEVPSQYEYD